MEESKRLEFERLVSTYTEDLFEGHKRHGFGFVLVMTKLDDADLVTHMSSSHTRESIIDILGSAIQRLAKGYGSRETPEETRKRIGLPEVKRC